MSFVSTWSARPFVCARSISWSYPGRPYTPVDFRCLCYLFCLSSHLNRDTLFRLRMTRWARPDHTPSGCQYTPFGHHHYSFYICIQLAARGPHLVFAWHDGPTLVIDVFFRPSSLSTVYSTTSFVCYLFLSILSPALVFCGWLSPLYLITNYGGLIHPTLSYDCGTNYELSFVQL